MPELPEVETVRRQLRKELLGFQFKRVESDTLKMVRPEIRLVNKKLHGFPIVEVERVGKYLLIRFGNGSYLTIHLRLNGRLFIRSAKDPQDLYQHVTIYLSQQKELRLTDSRKFAYIELITESDQLIKLTEKIGPEPFEINNADFFEILHSHKQAIKQLLLDQKLIGGIGNIYANDALWLAKINPETKANTLNRLESKNLLSGIKLVMEESLRSGGASDMWFLDTHGNKGDYQNHFKVYNRKGKPCLIHPNTLIEYIKIGQRGTFYCPKCQSKK